jgi:hypothetical protein
VAVLGFAGVPVAIGFAVLKYRLYDIDIIINRTLVYGSLTATLVGLYFGSVATTQTILRALTGQTEQPQIAIVVSTLVIAALFNPLRRRLQTFIDRRFYRRKYDARRTLDAFSARLRDKTDLEELTYELTGVIRETMQPEHVSLWLRTDRPPNGSRRFGNALSCGVHTSSRRSPRAGHGSSATCAPCLCRVVTDMCSARRR